MDDKEKMEVTVPAQIGVYYQRARHYRVLHADGAWAGISPQAKIQFDLYSEVRPSPEFVLHKVNEQGGLGEVLEQKVKEGILREVEIGVLMDLQTTIQFIKVLQQMVDQIQKFQRQIAESDVPTEPQITTSELSTIIRR